MKKSIKLLSICAVAVMVLTACGAKLPEDVVASVNGVNITKDYYDKTVIKVAEDNSFEDIYGEEIWSYEVEPGVTFKEKFASQMLNQIIDQEMIYQDAEAKQLRATDEEVEAEFNAYMEAVKTDPQYSEFLEKNNIDDAFIKEHIARSLTHVKYAEKIYAEAEVTDEEIQKYYDANVEKEFTDKKVRASHILFETKENKEPLSDEQKAEKLKLAEEVLERAKNGEDFAKLAEEYSADTVSAAEGGDLGYFAPGRMVPEFNDKAFSMEVGEISDIVETEFGYHIIYLTDKQENVLTLEQAKPSIVNTLKQQKYEEKIQELRKSSKIIVNKALEIK